MIAGLYFFFLNEKGVFMDQWVLDEDIQTFINACYGPDQIDEILRSFELFHGFGLQYAESNFYNIIAHYGYYDTATLSDIFIKEIRTLIEGIFKEHGLLIDPEVELVTYNEILSGLLLIQVLDDYNEIAAILESDMDSIEKLALIFSHITPLTELQLLDIIKSISDTTLKTLLAFCYEKEKTAANKPLDLKMLEKLKEFKAFMGDNKGFGYYLLENGIPLGQSFEIYQGHLISYLSTVKELPQKALDVLTVLLLIPDAYNLPLIYYRKINSQIFDDLNTIQKVDMLIGRILADFEEYKLKGEPK